MAARGQRRTASGALVLSDFSVTSGPSQFAVTVADTPRGFDVTVDGRAYHVELDSWIEPSHFVLRVEGSSTPVAVARVGEELRVLLGPDQHRFRVTRRVPIPRRAAAVGSLVQDVRVDAPMPGLIVAVQASPGSLVEQGASVVIMEAMKMQLEIRAPASGRVATVSVTPGQEVAKGQTLVTLRST